MRQKIKVKKCNSRTTLSGRIGGKGKTLNKKLFFQFKKFNESLKKNVPRDLLQKLYFFGFHKQFDPDIIYDIVVCLVDSFLFFVSSFFFLVIHVLVFFSYFNFFCMFGCIECVKTTCISGRQVRGIMRAIKW